MSKKIALIVTGGSTGLQALATSLVAKASKGAAELVVGATSEVAVAVGPDAPADAHTAVTSPTSTAAPIYAGVSSTFVRAILPRSPAGQLQLRDALDVLPSTGVSSDKEVEAAKQSFAKSVAIAVKRASATKASKITVLVKPQSKFAHLNQVFAEAAAEVATPAGISLEFVNSSEVSNQLVMFPESLGVVIAADTPTAEVVQGLVSGIHNGAPSVYYSDNSTIAAGNSTVSVARATAEALRASGFAAEAKKIEDAAAKSTDADKILAAL